MSFKLIPKSLWKMILGWFYKKKEMFVKKLWFSKEEKSVKGECYVPLKFSYGKKPTKYVTAENFVRCCSQLAYIIICLLVKAKVKEFIHITVEQFKELMTAHQMYYHFLKMKFSQQVPKDTRFPLVLTLRKAFHRKNMIACFLRISGTISGELEVLAVMNTVSQPLRHQWLLILLFGVIPLIGAILLTIAYLQNPNLPSFGSLIS